MTQDLLRSHPRAFNRRGDFINFQFANSGGRSLDSLVISGFSKNTEPDALNPGSATHSLTYALSYHNFQSKNHPNDSRLLYLFDASSSSLSGVVDFTKVDPKEHLDSATSRNYVKNAAEAILGFDKTTVTLTPSLVHGYLDIGHTYSTFVNEQQDNQRQFFNFMERGREHLFPSDLRKYVNEHFHTLQGGTTSGSFLLGLDSNDWVFAKSGQKVFHTTACKFLDNNDKSNVIVYLRSEAELRGLSACKVCSRSSVFVHGGEYCIYSKCKDGYDSITVEKMWKKPGPRCTLCEKCGHTFFNKES